ncbi:hypothetical protein Tco_1300906 [Tanacetum coccineum]
MKKDLRSLGLGREEWCCSQDPVEHTLPKSKGQRPETIAVADHFYSSLSELLKAEEDSLFGFCCYLLQALKASHLRNSFLPCPHPDLGHLRSLPPSLSIFEPLETLYGEVESRGLIIGSGFAEVEARLLSGVFSRVVAVNVETIMGGNSLELGVIPGIMYHDLYLGEKVLIKRDNMGFDLTKSNLCPNFVEDLTAKGVGLHVADSHTGNHREDGFTPLETIRRNFHELDYGLLEKLQDYWWKVNEHECSPFANWKNYIRGPYVNYYSNFLDVMEHEEEERCEVFDNHERPVCYIRIFEMVKYSFRDNKGYVAIKENEYDDLTNTSKDAIHAYQEIFRMMDEKWMVTRNE